MSLSYKLIGFFAAILTATSGVSAFIVARLGERQVEDEIRARALESGPEFNEELGKSSTFDRKTIEDKLASFLRTHSGFNAVELARVEHPGPDLILRVNPGPNGPVVERTDGEASIPKQATATLEDGPDGRFWSVSQRIKVGRDPGRLTVEASLAEADALAAKESKVFGIVTIGSALLLILAGAILISLLIGRPIARMTQTMSQVESGQLEVEAPLGASKEFDHLARGFNTMLVRIRGFNQELTGRIEEATAALAQQNHDLAELNDLLVAARRDLTAKERLAALGQLAGTIAHELGNPLNSISGHVQLLERSPDLPDDVREDLELISSEVRRMTDVIRRFLDSTRGLRPAPEQVDLTSLVSEALDMSLSAEARARLIVEKNVSPGLDAVITDPSLVRHVLTNLIANAVDAMPRGGELDLTAAARDGELCLSVRDTGSGISSEDRRRIFEPFYTTKARGKGTGLGLAICREIARALKGRIDVVTEVGRGSTFTLAVPLQRAGEASPQLQPAEAT